MACSDASPHTSHFSISIGPHKIFCTLERPIVIKMLKAFFDNRDWLSKAERSDICHTITERFKGAVVYEECPLGIEFDQL